MKKKMRKGEKMIEASLTLEPSICWHIWVGWSWDGDTFRDSKRKLKTQEENKQKGIFLHKNSSFVFFRRRQLRSHTEGFQFSSSSLFFSKLDPKVRALPKWGRFFTIVKKWLATVSFFSPSISLFLLSLFLTEEKMSEIFFWTFFSLRLFFRPTNCALEKKPWGNTIWVSVSGTQQARIRELFNTRTSGMLLRDPDLLFLSFFFPFPSSFFFLSFFLTLSLSFSLSYLSSSFTLSGWAVCSCEWQQQQLQQLQQQFSCCSLY